MAENIRSGCGEKFGVFLESEHENYDKIAHADFMKKDGSLPTTNNIEQLLPTSKIKISAELANINNFIQNQPEKYETPVGNKGSKLSGGQKQRTALARAFMRDSKILLLDEATSALDNESESFVNASLRKLAREHGRTIFIVAHRLSSIKLADVILMIDKGVVVERGSHEELVNREGFYYNLVKSQMK